jgi:hypothetical protein
MDANHEKITILWISKSNHVYNNDDDNKEMFCHLHIFIKYNGGAESEIKLDIETRDYEDLPDYISKISDFINGSENAVEDIFNDDSSIIPTDDGFIIVRIYDYICPGSDSKFRLHAYPFIGALKLTLQDMILLNNGVIMKDYRMINNKYRLICKANKMKCLLIWMGQKKQNCIFSMLNKELILIISDYSVQYLHDMIALLDN